MSKLKILLVLIFVGMIFIGLARYIYIRNEFSQDIFNFSSVDATLNESIYKFEIDSVYFGRFGDAYKVNGVSFIEYYTDLGTQIVSLPSNADSKEVIVNTKDLQGRSVSRRISLAELEVGDPEFSVLNSTVTIGEFISNGVKVKYLKSLILAI